MNNSENEEVLCVSRNDLPLNWLPEADLVRITWSEFLARLTGAVKPLFIARHLVENDRLYKQIIPYILLRDKTGKLAVYCRQGSETRLNGCFSLAVGGHIRREDFTVGAFSWAELGSKALLRELEEELPGFAPTFPPEFLGLINEEKTPVGNTHVGLVFIYNNVDAALIVPGEELRTLEWVEPCDLIAVEHKFELWSSLALKLAM